MSDKQKFSSDTYFSVSHHLIQLGFPLPYSLYINSSKLKERQRYIRVFPAGETLLKDDLEALRQKYFQLYIHESERNYFLRSLTSKDGVEDKEKATVIKDTAIHYLGNLFDHNKAFTTEYLNESIQGCRDSVENMVNVIKDYNVSQLQGLIGDLSFHDFYTYDHSINVSMYCISILKAMRPNATQEEMIMAGMGGLLHDLGKTKIPTEIINFSGKLTDDMFSEIKRHPGYGKELIETSGCDCEGINMEVIKRVVYEHHENFNGSGYPNKVEGKDIHLFARITAVADFFDAITTKRSYADVLSTEEAIHLMAASRGKKLDPQVFDIFARNAKVILMKGKIKNSVPDNFDPCQPQDEFPLQQVDKEVEARSYGKIVVMGEDKKKDKKEAS